MGINKSPPQHKATTLGYNGVKDPAVTHPY